MADFWLIMSSVFNIFIFVKIIKVVWINQMDEENLDSKLTSPKWKSHTDAEAQISNDDFKQRLGKYYFVQSTWFLLAFYCGFREKI